MESINKLIELIKDIQGSTILVITSITTLLLLFLPEQTAQQIGVNQARNEYQSLIGIVALASTVGWITLLVKKLTTTSYMTIKQQVNHYKASKKGKENLKNLTAEEQQILKQFIDKKTKTQTLKAHNGIVQGLQTKNIIYKASNVDRHWTHIGWVSDYNILDWAWDELRKHPELLNTNNDQETSKPAN